MKRYIGIIESNQRKVYSMDGSVRTELPLRLDLCNRSSGGFGWGYQGSGPAQLALALLADHLKDDEQALWFYDRFKCVVVDLPVDKNWELTSSQVDDALNKVLAEEE
jgi:hypothetical protein